VCETDTEQKVSYKNAISFLQYDVGEIWNKKYERFWHSVKMYRKFIENGTEIDAIACNKADERKQSIWMTTLGFHLVRIIIGKETVQPQPEVESNGNVDLGEDESVRRFASFWPYKYWDTILGTKAGYLLRKNK
jgi:hypothetical protein